MPGVVIHETSGDVVAYEFGLPKRFEPWAGRSQVERTYVLLDVGVSFANPLWVRTTGTDGTVFDRSEEGEDCWYADLVTVEIHDGSYTFTDLYVDVMVPTDGRHYRMLDLDEFADALEAGQMTKAEAIDGLRRWQRFIDTYIHSERWPIDSWSNFPPASIKGLAALPTPIGTPVFWDG